MARVALNDNAWEEVKEALQRSGCYLTKNTRTVLEAIIWKIRTGSPWRDIPAELGSWKTAYNRFNRMAEKGVWDDFFLLFEEKLKRDGYTPTEVMFELIKMQVELGLEKKERLDTLEEEEQQKFMWSPMRVDSQLILKSLGVTSTTSKLHRT